MVHKSCISALNAQVVWGFVLVKNYLIMNNVILELMRKNVKCGIMHRLTQNQMKLSMSL